MQGIHYLSIFQLKYFFKAFNFSIISQKHDASKAAQETAIKLLQVKFETFVKKVFFFLNNLFYDAKDRWREE